MHPLAAGGRLGRLVARDIGLVAGIGRAGALDELAGQEAPGAAADHLGDRLVGRRRREPRRHDEGGAGGRLGQRVQQSGEGAVQADHQQPVLRRAPFRHRLGQHLAEAVAHRPALQRGDAVAGPHRLAIMEAQPVAQPDGPGQAIGRDRMPRRHLRPRLQLRIAPVQRVEDAVAMRGGDGGRVEDRVQHRRRRLRHEAQGARPGGLAEGRQGGGRPAPAAFRMVRRCMASISPPGCAIGQDGGGGRGGPAAARGPGGLRVPAEVTGRRTRYSAAMVVLVRRFQPVRRIGRQRLHAAGIQQQHVVEGVRPVRHVGRPGRCHGAARCRGRAAGSPAGSRPVPPARHRAAAPAMAAGPGW